MERQLDMFVLYSCPRCHMPTDQKDGPCGLCKRIEPKVLKGGWGDSLLEAVTVVGALTVGALCLCAAALWLRS